MDHAAGTEVEQRAGLVAELRTHLSADFRRNPYVADRTTVVIWRVGQAAHGRRGPLAFAVRRLHGLVDGLWTRTVIGAELPRSVSVGPGVRLPHAGRGVILHPSVRIGSGATLYHRITLGVRGGHEGPVLGDDVYVGTGAAVIGPVHVGSRVSVGANAVVVRDVPAGTTAVGVPAHGRPPA